jgi:hypothetical protein
MGYPHKNELPTGEVLCEELIHDGVSSNDVSDLHDRRKDRLDFGLLVFDCVTPALKIVYSRSESESKGKHARKRRPIYATV